MRRVHLPVVHRSVSQEWLLIFRCQVRCVASTTLWFFFFRFFAFFFSKVECKKERVDWTAWSARWDLFGVSTRDVDKRERFESLSLHKVRPIEAMMMMLMTIKTCRMVRKLQVSKSWPKCWEREGEMHAWPLMCHHQFLSDMPCQKPMQVHVHLFTVRCSKGFMWVPLMPLLVKSEIIHFVSLIYEIRLVNKTLNHSSSGSGFVPLKKVAVNLFPHLNLIASQKRKKANVSLLRQISKTGYQDSQISAPTTCVLVNPCIVGPCNN